MSPAVCCHLDTIEFTAIPLLVVGCEGMPEDRLALGACADVNDYGKVGCCDDSPNQHPSRHAR
jgi:hypothetical protein